MLKDESWLVNQEQIMQQLQAAVELHNQGEHDQAEVIYRNVLSVDPNNFYALNFCGCICREKRSFDEGIDLLSRAATLQPGDADVIYNLGNVLKDAERWDEAMSCYEKSLGLRADYPDALNNLGVCLNEVGRYEHSEIVLRRAVSIQPGFAGAWLNLANTFKEQEKFEEAITSYRKAIEVKPECADACLALGLVMKEAGELEEAIAAYGKVIELKPDFADAYFTLGSLLKVKGEVEEAIKSYRKAIELKPDFADAYFSLAFLFIRHGRILEALNCLRDGDQNVFNSPKIKHLLGMLLVSQGHEEEGGLLLKESCLIDSSFARKTDGFSLRSETPEDFWLSLHADEGFHLSYWEQNPLRSKLASVICALDGVGSVLDCGCNVGANLFAINAINSQIKLKGVDMNANPIEFGKRQFMELGILVDMSVMRLQDLAGIETDSVDVAYTSAVLQHIQPEYIPDILSNMIRISRRHVVFWELHGFSPADAFLHKFFIDASPSLDGRWLHDYWNILDRLGVARESITAQQLDPKICLGNTSDANCIFSFPVP
ncbi:MAG: tetratricopeptide repeat protein [Cyanobacteriota bacterium]|nr:tetratricopeptide repeat protein [Cyanobacteriota bacterium]